VLLDGVEEQGHSFQWRLLILTRHLDIGTRSLSTFKAIRVWKHLISSKYDIKIGGNSSTCEASRSSPKQFAPKQEDRCIAWSDPYFARILQLRKKRPRLVPHLRLEIFTLSLQVLFTSSMEIIVIGLFISNVKITTCFAHTTT